MSFRRRLLLVHRWAGIVLAAFLVLAGLTGSFLAFHHEIDAALAPALHEVTPQARKASLDAIAARIEARDPDLVVGYFLWTPDPEKSIRVVMNTRAAAEAGRLDREAARHREIYVDPYSGRLLGERNWGEAGTSPSHIVPMVYRFHTSLFVGEPGQWFMALVAAVWLVSLLIGFVLAVPRLGVLRKAFAIRWSASRPRVFFDVHRTVGLSAGLLLVVSAFTGLYMNVPQVVEPAIKAVAPFTERPASVRAPQARRDDVWRAGWDAAYESARRAQPAHPAVVMGRVEGRGYYQVRFMPPDDIMDAGTIRLFIDGRDARLLGRFHDREGTVGDLVRIWQFPLHSGQAFGLPGRIVVCLAGFLPLVLAVTGLWIWIRRRRLRRHTARVDPSQTGARVPSLQSGQVPH